MARIWNKGRRIKAFFRAQGPAIKKFVKDNRLVSRGLTRLSSAVPAAAGAAAVANQLGYGRRRRRRKRTHKGRGIYLAGGQKGGRYKRGMPRGGNRHVLV